jgi:branched-chain amino acid transport system substrate-binding protein
MRLVAIALALAALGGSAGPSGASPAPLLVANAGLPRAVSVGAARYFASVNVRGGLDGRPIAFRSVNAGERPLAALAPTGTAETVPQLVLSGSAAARSHGWAVGYPPRYALEARVLARQIEKTRPGTRIAVLYSNDADGRELLAWFTRSARVALASTDLLPLRAARADTLVVLSSHPIGSIPRQGWAVYANAAGAAPYPGAVSTVFVRTPGDPSWAGDPTPLRYRPRNVGQALGLAAAYTLVDALRRAGSGAKRTDLLTALRRSVEADNPYLVPGIVVRGGIGQVALQRWSRGRWNIFTGPVAG